MKKIIRNTANAAGKAFWDSTRKSAEGVRNWPDWKKAGVTAEPPGFQTQDAAPLPALRGALAPDRR